MSLCRLLAWTLLRLLGWRFVGDSPSAPSVVVGYPHTSYMDSFIIAIASHVQFGYIAVKCDSLLYVILNRAIGAISVRRTVEGQTQQITSKLKRLPPGHFYIAPEGTTSLSSGVRSGFYHIAREMGYPLVPLQVDYVRREYSFGPPIDVTSLAYEEVVSQVADHYDSTGFGTKCKYIDRATPFVPRAVQTGCPGNEAKKDA